MSRAEQAAVLAERFQELIAPSPLAPVNAVLFERGLALAELAELVAWCVSQLEALQ